MGFSDRTDSILNLSQPIHTKKLQQQVRRNNKAMKKPLLPEGVVTIITLIILLPLCVICAYVHAAAGS